jgi:hypothetical protein
MQAFNRFLNFFTKFDMWDQVFPGADINTELVDSKDFIIVLANLFKKEKTTGLEKKLVQNFKIDIDKAKKIVFLLDFSNFNQPIEVFDLYKKKVASGAKDSTLLEWLKVTGSENNMLIKFIDYKPTISSELLMDQGFKGKDLGIKIKELESESFTNLLK